MDYLKPKRGKSPTLSTRNVDSPVLTKEDEEFLHRVATEDVPPPLPERPLQQPPQPQNLPESGNPEGNNAQIALLDVAQRVPLSEAPETPEGSPNITGAGYLHQGEGKEKVNESKKSRWNWKRRDSRDAKRKATASGLMSAAEGLKSPDTQLNEGHVVSDPEAQKEEDEMSNVLEQLNLAAVNNRVFSISKESQVLLHK